MQYITSIIVHKGLLDSTTTRYHDTIKDVVDRLNELATNMSHIFDSVTEMVESKRVRVVSFEEEFRPNIFTIDEIKALL